MMKRNILAVVIPALLAAGAANAAEIYNKDGNKLDLYGKVDARHSFSDNDKQDGDKSYVRFGFKGETQITDQLTGYGQWEYNIQANNAEGSGAQDGNATRLGFAGLKFAEFGSFDYGRNYGVIYDVNAWTDMLPVFGGDSISNSDNFMTGRSTGLATYRNNNFFGMVDGLNFALQYQGKTNVLTSKNLTVTASVSVLLMISAMAFTSVLVSLLQTVLMHKKAPWLKVIKPRHGTLVLNTTQTTYTWL